MSRAERRRAERQKGRKRAVGKKGRRASVRAPLEASVELDFPTLEKGGFVVSTPQIAVPERSPDARS
jgi:hypothetical protein